MKTHLLFLVFLICCGQGLNAQFFKLIPEDQVKLYFQTDNVILAAEVESFEDTGSEKIIHWEGLTEIHWPTECYHNSAPDFLGKKMWIDDSGDHLIQMDTAGDLIATIKTQALVDDSWICFDYNGETVTATCISIAIGSVNGIPEMIKTIRFSNDFCDLRISQTQGIISSPAWNQLYQNINEHNDQNVMCIDRIWDDTLIEKLNTPFGELAADLQEGDILHIEESYSQPPSASSRKLIKSIFLEKTFDTANQTYSLIFAEEVMERNFSQGQLTETEYLDTSEYFIGRYLQSSSELIDYPVPVNRIFNAGGQGEIFNYSLFNNKLALDRAGISFGFSEEDNCFPVVFDAGEGNGYIEGLGGPYYNNFIFYPRERTLKYYKKGTEEWGDPFTFIVSASEKIIPESFSIFPNPVAAGSSIFLQDLGGNEMLDVTLVDVYGKQVQNWQLKNTNYQESLQLDRIISPGLYVLWIRDKENHQYHSKLVIK